MIFVSLLADYGPSHPDYPNVPKDWSGEAVVLRDGDMVEYIDQWSHHDPNKDDEIFPLSQRDVVSYPTGSRLTSVLRHLFGL